MTRRQVVPAVVIIALLVGLVAWAWVGQRRLLYFPNRADPVVPDGITEVVLHTSDGLDLTAWWLPAEGAARQVPMGTVVVVFPGNAGNRAGRVRLGRGLARAGAHVLLVDYRGYGGNPGNPSAIGLARDARAALAWVVTQEGVDPDRIVLFGESLGSGVAIEVAMEHPPAALVLRSPFTSLAELAQTHYRIVPGWFLRDRWSNEDRIGTIDRPVLVVAGDADQIVPVDQSERVHAAAAASGTSEIFILEGADHNESALLHGRVVVTAITTFLADHLGR